jgi:hypothetical protein
MHADISDISARLSGRAEDFCRAYLGNGQRKGAYWVVGDARGAPGRSLYVKISGSRTGLGAMGRWCDAATGEHGDLLDLLALNQAHNSMTETLAEARRFLSAMGPIQTKRCDAYRNIEQRRIAAQRLFSASIPYEGTPAHIYFATRGIVLQEPEPALRFHPRCHLRLAGHSAAISWPGVIAGVTDLTGTITGVQRIFLAGDGLGKAPIDDPKRALGLIHGHGVWLGPRRSDTIIVGEGLETMLALRMVLPTIPCVATLAASHLPAFTLPDSLSRLIIAADQDEPGLRAALQLLMRTHAQNLSATIWIPETKDWNTELEAYGAESLRARLTGWLAQG